MAFCEKCGTKLPEGALFCGNCGNRQTPVQPQQPVYTQPQQPVYAQPVYNQPQQPVYAQPVYNQPQQPAYTQPAQPEEPKKKNIWKILLPIIGGVVLLVVAIILIVSLSGTPVESLEIQGESEISLDLDDTYWLECVAYPADHDDDIDWYSSNTDVAIVRDGQVIAVGEGRCTIEVAASSGVRDSIIVNVIDGSYQESLLVGVYSLDFTHEGDYTTDPDDATLYIYADGTGELYYYGVRYRSFVWYYSHETDRGYYYTAITDDGMIEEIFLYGPLSDYSGDVNYYPAYGETFYFNG